MITILCIGIVTALAVLALVLKTCMTKPQKAQKAEKAAIVKQLLALSEADAGLSARAPSRTATLRAVPTARVSPTRLKAQRRFAQHLPQPAIRTSQPVHPSQRPC